MDISCRTVEKLTSTLNMSDIAKYEPSSTVNLGHEILPKQDFNITNDYIVSSCYVPGTLLLLGLLVSNQKSFKLY